MIKQIRGYFGMDGSEDVSLLNAEEHTRFAIATVLISAALSDSTFVESERELLLKQLERHLGISSADAALLELKAEHVENKQLLQQYIEALLGLSVAQREKILSLAWGILTADSNVGDDETKFAAKLRHTLGLSIEQSIRARKLAENVSEDGFKEAVEASTEVHDALQEQLRRLHPMRNPRS